MPGTNLHFRKQNTIEDVSTVPPTPRTPVTQIAADYPLDPCRFELSLGDRNLVEHGRFFINRAAAGTRNNYVSPNSHERNTAHVKDNRSEPDIAQQHPLAQLSHPDRVRRIDRLQQSRLFHGANAGPVST